MLALEGHGFFSDEATVGKSENGQIVNLNDITRVWEQHNDKSFASTFPEFDRLNKLRNEISHWSSTFDQTLTSDTLSLQERCKKLEGLTISRPKGVVANPTPDSINLWLQVFSWPLAVHAQMKLLTEQYEAWRNSNLTATDSTCNTQLMSIVKSNMTRLIGSGQVFLLDGNISPGIAHLRDEAVALICCDEGNNTSMTTEKLLNSTCHAKVALSHVFEVKEDDVASSLVILRVMFWKIIVSNFLRRIDNAETDPNPALLHKLIDLQNARAVLSLCPRSTHFESDIIKDRSNEMRLQSMVQDAIELESRANAILMHAAELLKIYCFKRKDDLNMSLDGLTALKADFNSNPNVSLMLRNSCIEQHLSEKIEAVTWILKSMTLPVLWGDVAHESGNTDGEHRISLGSLTDLHSSIPALSQMDAEVIRMATHVQNMLKSAKSWQVSFSALAEDEPGKIVDVSTIKSIAQASIISMVILPNEDAADEIYKKALLMKDGLETKLLTSEKPNSHDVYKGKFPTEESLVGDDGDFLLFRLTVSMMICFILLFCECVILSCYTAAYTIGVSDIYPTSTCFERVKGFV